LLNYLDFTDKDLYVISDPLSLFYLSLIFASWEFIPKNKADTKDQYWLNLDPYSFKIEEQIKEAIQKLNKKNSKGLKDHTLINSEILENKIYDYSQTQEYFTSLKEIETLVKSETLRKLFKLSQNEDNFKEISKDVLNLQRAIRK